MIVFIIILLILFLVGRYWNVILLWFLRRRLRKMFGNSGVPDDMNPFSNSGRTHRNDSKGGWSTPAPKPKKFSKGDGEYVKFTEITVTETSASQDSASGTDASSTHTTFTTEQQITDAEWEEIK